MALIDNWVEERQCAHLDTEKKKLDGTLNREFIRSGHKKLLSNEDGCEYSTTIQTSYTPPTSAIAPDKSTGERQKLITEKLYDMVKVEAYAEHVELPSVDYSTTTHLDYSKDVEGGMSVGDKSAGESSVKVHSLDDQPSSYWSQNSAKVTGITAKFPFKKNATFSCPIELKLD